VDPAAHRGGSQPSSPAIAAAVQPWWEQQDHDPAQADAVGPCSRASRSQGQPAVQVGLASTLEGRILAAASSSRLCCGRLQRPVRLLHLGDPSPPVTSRTSGHPLSAASLASRGAVPSAPATAQRLALKILVGTDGVLPNRR
jgi:hypothetical protein